jgi:hypothetical protein
MIHHILDADDLAGEFSSMDPLSIRIDKAVQLHDAMAGHDRYAVEFVISGRRQGFPDPLGGTMVFDSLVRTLKIVNLRCAVVIGSGAARLVPLVPGTSCRGDHQQQRAEACEPSECPSKCSRHDRVGFALHSMAGKPSRWWPIVSIQTRQVTRGCSSDLPRFDNQQQDPADERERSDDGRNKVAIGRRNVNPEELDRFARSRKCDARVCEHENAQSDQNDRNNGFSIHKPPVGLLGLPGLIWLSCAC